MPLGGRSYKSEETAPLPSTCQATLTHSSKMQEQPPDDTYAFRLFAPSKQTRSQASSAEDLAKPQNPKPSPSEAESTSIARIRLSPPAPDNADITRIEADSASVSGNRKRPQSYYIVPAPSAEQKRRFEDAAVSGSRVLENSRRADWSRGLQYPWKVMGALAGRDIVDGTSEAAEKMVPVQHGARLLIASTAPKRHTRKSKKTRLKIRIRWRAEGEEKRKKREAAEEKKREVAEKAKEKEAYLREKKTRTNRMKQIKKREKKRTEK